MSRKPEAEISSAEAKMTPPGQPVEPLSFPSALESGSTTNALAAQQPNLRRGEVLQRTTGYSTHQADIASGIEEPLIAQTPGVTPAAINHAQLALDVKTDHHHARNPSNLGGRALTLADAAEQRSKRKAEERERDRAAKQAKPTEGSNQELATFESQHGSNRVPHQPVTWIDMEMLKS